VVKIWDSLMKRLMQASPQDLVSWIFPNAIYQGELNTELQKEPVRADLMYTVEWKGRQGVCHIEFQTRHDDEMGRRVWEYNVLTTVCTGLPVRSVVIYLLKDKAIVQPSYTVEFPESELIHHFVFRHMKLWEIPPEVLIQFNLPGLLPLLPLTQGGDQREVVELMVRRLWQTGRKDLLAIGCSFADLMFKQESDWQWLKEMTKRMEDILEESRFLQEWMQKGSLRELRSILIQFTTLRFPDLVSQAQKQSEQAQSPEQLRAMMDKLFTATTVQEASAALTS